MKVMGWTLSEGRCDLRKAGNRDEDNRWQKKREGDWAFRFGFGSLTFESKKSQSAQAISDGGRTLSRRGFTKGRTESDFLHYALGELRGH